MLAKIDEYMNKRDCENSGGWYPLADVEPLERMKEKKVMRYGNMTESQYGKYIEASKGLKQAYEAIRCLPADSWAKQYLDAIYALEKKLQDARQIDIVSSALTVV